MITKAIYGLISWLQYNIYISPSLNFTHNLLLLFQQFCVECRTETWFLSDRLESWTKCASVACITCMLAAQQQTAAAAAAAGAGQSCLHDSERITHTEGQLSKLPALKQKGCGSFCRTGSSWWPLKTAAVLGEHSRLRRASCRSTTVNTRRTPCHISGSDFQNKGAVVKTL